MPNTTTCNQIANKKLNPTVQIVTFFAKEPQKNRQFTRRVSKTLCEKGGKRCRKYLLKFKAQPPSHMALSLLNGGVRMYGGIVRVGVEKVDNSGDVD